MITIENVLNFDLKSTITCGQIFRYEVLDNDSYLIVTSDRVLIFKQEDDKILVTSNNEENLKEYVMEYLDLNRDYDLINQKLISLDKNLIDIIDKSRGLHMIKSNPFETCMSYIISANNSVPSIRNSLNQIAENYGKKVFFNGKDYYLFPGFKDLISVTVEDYRNCKVGFRDKYLYEFVKYLNENNNTLDDLYKMTTDEAYNKLICFAGIGNKVASCILLFAYQRFDVFPVDTWVKKQMNEMYGLKTEKEMVKFAKEKYQDNSAIALQYMFHARRNG